MTPDTSALPSYPGSHFGNEPGVESARRKAGAVRSKALQALQGFKKPVGGLSKEDQAKVILRAVYTIAPVVAGADKFTNRLTSWEKYLDPRVSEALGISPATFMRIVGVIEIAAGLGVAIRPRIFGYVVSAWLIGIIGNLLVKGSDYDVALRDFGLSVGALSLARLSSPERPKLAA